MTTKNSSATRRQVLLAAVAAGATASGAQAQQPPLKIGAINPYSGPLATYGEEQFTLWRRSYDTPPPPIDPDDEWATAHDPRYAMLPPDTRPATECLADVVRRMIPYWEDVIVAEHLAAGRTTMVVAHGNSLRALVKHLDGISDDGIASLNIPTGIPLVYRLDHDMRPLVKGGEYLDPAAAATAAAAVANQGRS